MASSDSENALLGQGMSMTVANPKQYEYVEVHTLHTLTTQAAIDVPAHLLRFAIFQGCRMQALVYLSGYGFQARIQVTTMCSLIP